ncbi:WecB/TagA/CpsF family glycosyltransferase [Sodalinema gerasimenkoae]|uniref:WecB/TagA/CpsF family glycosyltransferase n=1 Tax=Sodalinema gerasimenkoae TaxID=2862348 RepID=UPI00135A6E40|nr:WecB/TagA/CpsF family glycosyltransferase [Sodalinema gerasimenkoae]
MTADPLPRLSILGSPVHLHPNYCQWLRSQLDQQRGLHVVTLNAEMTMQAQQNPQLAAAIQQADLVIPDGAGVVLYLKLVGQPCQRQPGIELAQQLLAQLSPQEPVVCYGGKPEVIQQAARHLRQQYPHLTLSGVYHGYLNQDEQHQLLQDLHQQQPAVILVGLGVPRQELWIQHHRHHCPRAIWIGVGGSFDIWGGVKPRAPRWMGDNHLEWAYRLYQEPWRWRRMLALPKFAWNALVEIMMGNRQGKRDKQAKRTQK